MKAEKQKSEWITGAELARRRKCTPGAVVHAHKGGVITRGKNGKFKWPDVLEEWDANTNVSAREGKTKGSDEKWQEARTRREIALADLAEIGLQEKNGQVVQADFAENAIFSATNQTRNRILGVAKQVAPILVGVQDEREIARILSEYLSTALENLNGLKLKQVA